MDTVDKTLDRIYCELNDILQHPKLDRQDVELMGEFIDMLKDVAEMDSYTDKGYSQMSNDYSRNSYMNGRSGRTPINMRGYSQNYSRSSNKDELIDHLQNIMNMAEDERDRKAVNRLIDQMEKNSY